MMDTAGVPKHGLAEKTEGKLNAALEDKDPHLPQLEAILQEYRRVCQDKIFDNFESVTSKNIEGKLWDAHIRVNGRFRKRLAYFRGLKGKEKKPVERRKTAKLYLDFVKSSQRFYRGYIQRLVSLSGGIPELQDVAHRFSSDATAVLLEEKHQTTPEFQHAISQSCHQTLIHLGDLSRYRESELNFKGTDRNWGPAIGYYDLAIAIDPSSGTPYNQLAIISKTEGDHARALYHLYRAQSALEPPPTAFANLQLEFRKIREGWERGNLTAATDKGGREPLLKLQSWFPSLHARCFDGVDFAEYDGLERNVLDQLASGLKARSLETGFLNRMILSNIAADFAAGDRWQEAPDIAQNERAFKLFQRLNIRTFSTILELVRAEYKDRYQDNADKVHTINPVTRRLLPGLRFYSFWLISRAALLSAHLGDSMMIPFLKEFWTVYLQTLTLIMSTTRFEELPRPEYLLEEDDEIIGFTPLQEGQLQQRFLNLDGTSRKPKCHGHGIKRHHPNIEMLCRFRDFVEDAIDLAHNEYVPVEFVQDTGCFIIQRDWPGLGLSQASLNGGNRLVSIAAKQTNASQPEDTSFPDAQSTTDEAVSQATSVPISLSTTMEQMVDDLVGPEPSTSAVPLPSTTPAPTLASAQGDGPHETSYGVGNSTLTALEFVNQVRSLSPKGKRLDNSRPSLPSILNSPFAPQPEEGPALTRLSTSHKRKQPQSQRQYKPQPQHELPVHTVESSSSSMSDPTQQSFTMNGHLLHPLLRNKVFGERMHHATIGDEFNFDSSNIVTGSSFPYNARDHASQPTPPNGQG